MTSKKEDIEIDLDDHVFMELAKIAHEKDITFNQLVNDIIREKIKKVR
jgi:predicted DNA-binding ribbon-helix-helix protein